MSSLAFDPLGIYPALKKNRAYYHFTVAVSVKDDGGGSPDQQVRRGGGKGTRN